MYKYESTTQRDCGVDRHRRSATRLSVTVTPNAAAPAMPYAIGFPSRFHSMLVGLGVGYGVGGAGGARGAALRCARASAIAPLARVAIVDLDVHHGDGIQDILWDEPRALYCSVHCIDVGGENTGLVFGMMNGVANVVREDRLIVGHPRDQHHSSLRIICNVPMMLP